MVEFSAALVLLVIGIFIPIFDFGVIPLRWILWQEALNIDARRLARCENFSTAKNTLTDNTSLTMYNTRIDGVNLISPDCDLVISMVYPPYDYYVAQAPNEIRAEWLPGGPKSPCYYEMEVNAVVEISPLFLWSGIKTPVPGLTVPLTCKTKARAHWENYGRNPVTNQFYVQE